VGQSPSTRAEEVKHHPLHDVLDSVIGSNALIRASPQIGPHPLSISNVADLEAEKACTTKDP
jgi:hypothetical protein